LADVRFEAHYGLMQGMARGPKVTRSGHQCTSPTKSRLWVHGDHHADQVGMPRLLLTLQGKCSLENRIADGMGEGGDDRTGAALGVEHLLPKWNGLEAVQRGRVQHRPRQGLGIVFDISPSKMCAERITMFLRSNFHASPPIREADIAERLTRLLHQRRRSTRVASRCPAPSQFDEGVLCAR
jgi:hypothetical protein